MNPTTFNNSLDNSLSDVNLYNGSIEKESDSIISDMAKQ